MGKSTPFRAGFFICRMIIITTPTYTVTVGLHVILLRQSIARTPGKPELAGLGDDHYQLLIKICLVKTYEHHPVMENSFDFFYSL